MIPREDFEKYIEDIKKGITFPAEKPYRKEDEALLKDWDGIIVTKPYETDCVWPDLSAVKVKFYNGYTVYHYFYSRLDNNLFHIFEKLPRIKDSPKTEISHLGGFAQIKIFKGPALIAKCRSKSNISFAEVVEKMPILND
jgi:hypothetical protein